MRPTTAPQSVHPNGKIKGAKRGGGNKQKIFALIERDGATRAFHVPEVTGATLKPILQSMVAKVDAVHGFRLALEQHAGRHVCQARDGHHMAKEYVRGEVHTNSIESFFGLLKRGIVGTYHHVSSTHLQRYCEEFSFCHSHRTSLGVSDEQRAVALLKQVGGKRLTYRRTNAASQAVA